MEEGILRLFDEQFIPVRMLNEYRYCPRLAYIEFVDGDFVDNEHTIEGSRRHESVDDEKGRLPGPDEVFGDFKAKGVTLSSEEFGIISRLDIIESKNDKVSPVEIKKGKGPDDGAWPADIVQIGAHIQILKDNGYDCNEGFIYYAKSNKKVLIEYNDDVLLELVTAINGMQSSMETRVMPPPLRNSSKCDGCSLAPICLPDEINALSEDNEDIKIRRMFPSRDDTRPLILQEQGSYLSKKGDILVIKKRGEKVGEVRTFEISHVCLYGNAQVSTQALSELLDRNIPVLYFSYGGWFKGYSFSLINKNVDLRMKQYEHAMDKTKRLMISRKIVEGKVKNCRTLLRRNCEEDCKKALDELKKTLNKLSKVKDIPSLLGVEGNAGRIYFGSFNKMIKNGFRKDFNFESRNRRPPTDPINSLLSLSYSTLCKDLTVSSLTMGLDPMLGFYHRPRYGRPALALDLMEEFRPIIADSVVISLINNDVLDKNDFIIKGKACNLTTDGRKKFYGAYERRVSQIVKHPIFGYQVSYRRIFETQVRLMSRYLAGELKEYIPFVTR